MRTLKLSYHERAGLEAMIDKAGMIEVLEELAQIAYEKAEHVQANWQDTSLAICWHSAAEKLEDLALDPAIKSIDPT